MSCDSRTPSRLVRDSQHDLDYDIDLLTKVIEYNHKRYLAFKNNQEFIKNPEYEKILNARCCKVGRIKRRLIYLLSRYKHIWFVTFTFNNNYINKSNRTKKDLIKEVINSHDFKYILNNDYGKKTEREHYHCIIATNLDMDINQYIQNYYRGGFSLSIECKTDFEDFKRLSKYINKLTNHCIKATTKRQRLVYNFKGYDNLTPIRREQTNFYYLDLWKLFSVENDSLLDKAVITGKNC